MVEIYCPNCKDHHPPKEFYKRPTKLGRDKVCRHCRNIKAAEARGRKHPRKKQPCSKCGNPAFRDICANCARLTIADNPAYNRRLAEERAAAKAEACRVRANKRIEAAAAKHMNAAPQWYGSPGWAEVCGTNETVKVVSELRFWLAREDVVS